MRGVSGEGNAWRKDGEGKMWLSRLPTMKEDSHARFAPRCSKGLIDFQTIHHNTNYELRWIRACIIEWLSHQEASHSSPGVL